ncbi:Alpha carbonic anhydrase 7 [Capsicum annuum]|nr:Alpha carbonic anhydrase 7 [Capsicum annuum]
MAPLIPSIQFWGWARGLGVIWAKNRPRHLRQAGVQPSVGLWGRRGHLDGQTGEAGGPDRLRSGLMWPFGVGGVIWVVKRVKQHKRAIFGPNRCAIAHGSRCGLGFHVCFGSKIDRGTPEDHDDEVEDQVEFSYKEGSKKGPSKWGELHKEWKTCKIGKMQSPIDISSCGIKKKRKLGHKKLYKPSNSTLRNRGHDISLHWHGDAGSILMNGTKYPLLQIHWHSPSEHTINGRRYALELHMVHHNTDEKLENKIVVNAVLYKFGRPDTLLFIVQPVSKSQVKLLREAVHDHAVRNARPLQPRNKRRIHLYSKECEYPSCQL